MTGVIAYIMWGRARLYLIGWGNRIGTIYQWARNLVFTKNRNHRIITFYRSRKDLTTGRLESGRLRAILPASTRPDDQERPLAPPPPMPASEPRPA